MLLTSLSHYLQRQRTTFWHVFPSGTTTRKAVHYVTSEVTSEPVSPLLQSKEMGSPSAHALGASHAGQSLPPAAICPNGSSPGFASRGMTMRLMCQDHTQRFASRVLRAQLRASCVPSACSHNMGESKQWAGSRQPLCASTPAEVGEQDWGSASRRRRPAQRRVGACGTNEASDGCINVFPAPTDYKECLAEQESVCLLHSAQTVASVNTSHMSN